ncbi:MAG: amidohydrolase [Saprospirales bacterium]|nr:amidohydrolase [Saprospirales bacterium]
MALTTEYIAQLAREIHPEVVALRRHLHQHPELSFQEERTAAYVAARLEFLGIFHKKNVAGHGVVGWIRGRNPEKRLIALRADMDALPIMEENEVPYRSQHQGVMHACGHDVHTASLLGTAQILQQTAEEWEGTVQLIFQPGEELLPGGASLMIAEGVLDHPRPALILGQHVHPSLEAGRIGLRPGMFMASSDEIFLTITGKGGHGATPHECIDPILIASHLVVALQQVVSRRANPTTPSVLTLGRIQSMGGATNIIPDKVEIMGTFRTMDENWRKEAHQVIRTLATNLAEGMGGKCEVRIVTGYPFLVNEEGLTGQIRTFAREYLGEEDQVVELPMRMSAEDFAYYSQLMPACFYRLGTGNPVKGINAPVHTPTFDIDEAALETGSGLMAWLAICLLNNEFEQP